METTAASSPRFIFRGNAMPFGGRITNIDGQSVSKLLPSPPTAALPVTGGSSRTTARGSTWLASFNWGATVAESTGEVRADGHAFTTVTASIENVSAKNDPFIFEADLLRVTVVSDHPTTGEPSIYAKEIEFGGPKGMFLDKKPIRVEYDNDLNAFPTFSAYENQYRTNEKFFRKYQAGMARPKSLVKPAFGEVLPRETCGYVATTIVRSITYNGKKIAGNVLTLKGFGSIFFGELLMSENNRRLTLVRLAMGSSMSAEMAYAEVDPNGTWGY